MTTKNKAIYVKIGVAVALIIFLILFFNGMEPKAVGWIFTSGGVLGLITKTMPFYRNSSNRTSKFTIRYSDDSILGPIMNIFIIFLGLVVFCG